MSDLNRRDYTILRRDVQILSGLPIAEKYPPVASPGSSVGLRFRGVLTSRVMRQPSESHLPSAPSSEPHYDARRPGRA